MNKLVRNEKKYLYYFKNQNMKKLILLYFLITIVAEADQWIQMENSSKYKSGTDI
jgi:hypothetical protein